MKNKKEKIIKPEVFSYEALLNAYYDCRKHKRSTAQALDFEFNLEKNLQSLYEEILSGEYQISRSICFVVTDPKLREVWAGNFRDRIVHHLIYNAIYERFSKNFILDTYSCIPKRGTLFGANRVSAFARKLTRNYSEDAYFLKADIGNYFNSINKDILFEQIKRRVFEPWLLELIEKVIYHDPNTNVFKKSSKKLFEALPEYKSLYNAASNKGLPIGNLTSQFFSNIYLNDLDQFVKHVLKCKYYGRYVDDIILLHKDAGYLNWAYGEINKFLRDKLDLWLNHKKKNMNKISRGFDFIGFYIAPGHRHLRRRTVKKSFKAVEKWEQNENRFEKEELVKFRNTINSYLGMYKHVNGYNIKKELSKKATTLFTKPNEGFSKIDILGFD